MFIRSYKYPDDDNYVDTTKYDHTEKMLDIAYQRLKCANFKFVQPSLITKLLIDHNRLSTLPDPNILPNLQELSCGHNLLTNIPFYPKLKYLSAPSNYLVSITNYHRSNLNYIDLSNNENLILNIILPECQYLFLSNCKLKTFNNQSVPNVKYLDCSHNDLIEWEIGQEDNLFYSLLELNIQANNLSQLSVITSLRVLLADYNKLTYIPTFPNLTRLDVSHNKISHIDNQPNLINLIANSNKIYTLKQMPNLVFVDLSKNNLTEFNPSPKIQTLDLSNNNIKHINLNSGIHQLNLQFNPIQTLNLDLAIPTLEEMKIGLRVYTKIYEKYQNKFTIVNQLVCGDHLKSILIKLSDIFDSDTIQYVFHNFNKINFQNKYNILSKIALKIYWRYFRNKSIKTIKNIIQTDIYYYLFRSLEKIYNNIVIVTICFDKN